MGDMSTVDLATVGILIVGTIITLDVVTVAAIMGILSVPDMARSAATAVMVMDQAPSFARRVQRAQRPHRLACSVVFLEKALLLIKARLAPVFMVAGDTAESG